MHPFLETAFDLGTKGIERLKQDTEELEENRSYRYSFSRSCHEHLSAFCRYSEGGSGQHDGESGNEYDRRQ